MNRFRVLDECDEMLNMGFVDDVEKACLLCSVLLCGERNLLCIISLDLAPTVLKGRSGVFALLGASACMVCAGCVCKPGCTCAAKSPQSPSYH